MSVKRPAPEAVATGALKKVKPFVEADPDGSWTCAHCQNLNWPMRTQCNKPECRMPRDSGGITHPEGSWACVGCTNINWPKRTHCNKCQLPRAGNPAGALASAQGGAQPGSWTCPSCSNLNWPMRTQCNKCRAPKPAFSRAPPPPPPAHSDPMAIYYQAVGLDPYAMRLMDRPGMGMGGLPNMGLATAPGHPPGSWPCPKCNNMNWPKRTTCNRPNCGTPRPGVAPGPGLDASGNPEGSWACPACANINWPQRAFCNKKECQTPRP